MAGADGVFHVAGWYRIGVRDRDSAVRVNVEGTRNVLETMRELGIPKGVYTSTLAVFGDTRGQVVDETFYHGGPFLSLYDETKWRAHYEVALPLAEEGLPLVIVLPGLVYGSGDEGVTHLLFRSYLKRRLVAAPRQTGFCWGHVEDTVWAHLLAMERGRVGQSYIIAGPPHTLVHALEIAQRSTGISAPRVYPPPGLIRGLAGALGALEKAVPLPEGYSSESLRILAGATYWGSNAKARQELGYQPRPLADGLPGVLRDEMGRLGMHG
jgi:nucleoside-diphosphate-sugar epimerase